MMTQVQRILVPVDFSEGSRRALEYAADLARRYGATIDVLHVWDVPTYLPADTLVSSGSQAWELTRLAQSTAEANLEKFVAEAAEEGIPIARTRAEPGVPSQVIADAAKNDDYDLIVMGTQGRTGLPRVLLGSVAERVVRHATCPVLTVREKPHEKP
jgi:nucleotide-binding universal stress UspA family protein